MNEPCRSTDCFLDGQRLRVEQGSAGHEPADIRHGKRLLPAREHLLPLGAGIAARDWKETPQGLAPLDRPDPARVLMGSAHLVDIL